MTLPRVSNKSRRIDVNPQQPQRFGAQVGHRKERRRVSCTNHPMMQIIAPVSSDIFANEILGCPAVASASGGRLRGLLCSVCRGSERAARNCTLARAHISRCWRRYGTGTGHGLTSKRCSVRSVLVRNTANFRFGSSCPRFDGTIRTLHLAHACDHVTGHLGQMLP